MKKMNHYIKIGRKLIIITVTTSIWQHFFVVMLPVLIQPHKYLGMARNITSPESCLMVKIPLLSM